MYISFETINILNKMKIRKHNALSEQFQNLNIKIVDRDKIETLAHKYMTSNTQMHDL
jgi:hypothetical protein